MTPYEEVKIDSVPVNGETPEEKVRKVTYVEQFVKDACDFSSQYANNISISYSAFNIAGNPSKFPDYGDSPQAFVMRTYGPWWDVAPSRLVDFMPQNNGNVVSQDYIELEYYKEVYPIWISVYETYNPGSVVRIWARNEDGKWLQLWSGLPQTVPHQPRVFSPNLKPCNFKTKMIRLEFNHELLDYYTELDAVLLIGTTELLVPKLHSQNQSLGTLVQELNCSGDNSQDVYNLTPNYLNVNQDIAFLKRTLAKYFKLYEDNLIGNTPKGKLLSKIGHHCQYIPPIQEAANSLQQFLQEEFPKLMRDIRLNSSPRQKEQLATKDDDLVFSKEMDVQRCGSFSALPDETVLKILEFLDLKSLCRLSRVNKHFNSIAKDALLYTSLNLKPYWYCLDAPALNNLSSRCRYLQRLDLSWCGNNNSIKDKDFVKFLRACGSLLTHLRLNSCHFVNDSVISEIAKVCRNLKELSLRNCIGITNGEFSKLENLEGLERLELYRTNIKTATLCSILKKNCKMRHLNLAGASGHLNIDEVAIQLGNSCPQLESVDFWKAQTFTPVGLRALTYCTNLREIDFGWWYVLRKRFHPDSTNLFRNSPRALTELLRPLEEFLKNSGLGAPGESLQLLLSSCWYLEKVFLTALRGLTDRDLEPLLLCPHLRQLDLLGARCVSPEICLAFMVCCPQLEMIDLSFCEGISDTRVQDWREKYPRISIKRS